MPSTVVERYEKQVKYLLGLLEQNPEGFRRKDLKTKWLIKGFPEPKFNSILVSLRNRGYVIKSDLSYKLSPYVITEAGRQYLRGLRA